MIITMRMRCVLVIALLLSGCQTVPSVSDLQPITNGPSFVLATSFRSATKQKGLGRSVAYGLLAGTYTAEKRNAEGTFFRGPASSVVFENVAAGGFVAQPGGVWIPEAGNASPRLYVYSRKPEVHARDMESLLGVPQTASASAVKRTEDDLVTQASTGSGFAYGNPAFSGTSGAVAGAVGASIVMAVIDATADPENIMFLFSIEDAALHRDLLEQVGRPKR